MTPNFRVVWQSLLHSAEPRTRVRLAPTPSGYLHAGNALNFVLNWLLARRQPGGKVLLRIDDLDADRKRPEYIQDVFDSLQWLGLDWDEGPRSVANFEENWSQHLRIPLYNSLLDSLRAKDLLYACGKSRKDLAPYEGQYPLEFREQGLSLDAEDVAWRIRTPDNFPLPDFIVRRRDGIPAYQIASLADDLFFKITHIVRGEDLRASTLAQQWLSEQLNYPEFLNIHPAHHPLLLDSGGEKMSKSAGASSLKAIRESGLKPDVIFQQVADLLGVTGRFSSAKELLERV